MNLISRAEILKNLRSLAWKIDNDEVLQGKFVA